MVVITFDTSRQIGGFTMKKLYGFYRTERNGNFKCMIVNDYNTKKDFKNDLKGNGYRVVEVLSDNEVQEIKNLGQWDTLKYNEEVKEYIEQCL